MTKFNYAMIGLKIQNYMDEIANLVQRIQQSERRTSRPAGTGIQYACLLKTKDNGDTLWFKTYRGSNIGNIAYSVYNTADNGFLLAGTSLGTDNYPKMYIIKTDSLGNEIWSEKLGDSLSKCEARSIIEKPTRDIVVAGKWNNDAFFGYLAPSGYIKTAQTYPNAIATTIFAADSGYYIISGNTVPGGTSKPQAWVQYLNELGDSVYNYSESIYNTSNCNMLFFDNARNGFIGCGSYVVSGTTTIYPMLVFPGPAISFVLDKTIINPLCPVWYERSVRMPFTSGNNNNYFLQKIFDWDYAHSNTDEQDVLLDWIYNNRITKLIIDGLYYPVIDSIPGQWVVRPDPSHPSMLDSVYNSGTCRHCTQLSNFITAARQKGVKKVYGTIHNLAEESYGSIKASDSEIVRIATYNMRSDYSDSTGKIDGFWIDYEFWINQSYCSGETAATFVNRLNDTIFRNVTLDNLYPATYNSNNYTEWGFKKFKELVGFADSMKRTVNSNCSHCNMVKSEVLLEPNFNFDVDESSGQPPLNIGFINSNPFPFVDTGGYNGNMLHDTAHSSLAQCFIFTNWLEDTANHVGSISIDLSTFDGRVSHLIGTYRQECLSPAIKDTCACDAFTPDHFLNNDVENILNNHSHPWNCTDQWEPQHLNAANQGDRQRCFDFLGSFANANIPIWPYFGAENPRLDAEPLLGNYMLGDINPDLYSDSAYGICGNTSRRPSAIHSIPDIHAEFMRQYRNSWSESFAQRFNTAINGYHTVYDPINQDTFVYNHFHLRFDTVQTGLPHPKPWWGGYKIISGDTTHTNLTIAGMEWFPMNSFPLTLDNSYSSIDRVDAFDTLYPDAVHKPFMQMSTTNRIIDALPDTWIACPIPWVERKANTIHNKTTSILMSLQAKMYPNPSDGIFNLSYQLPTGKGKIFITDISGRIVYDYKLVNIIGIQKIDISNLENSIYYWKVIDDNGNCQTGRLTLIKLK